MLDQKWIRSELDILAKVLLKKDFKLDVSKVTKMEGKRKELQLQPEALQSERNPRSKMRSENMKMYALSVFHVF